MNTKPHFDFLRQFFNSYECPVIEESSHHLKVQLTSQMDEEIMNRPFYWHYMKKMNRPGDPMRLTFTHTDHAQDGGIFLHAGTPKLHTIYQTAMEKGKTARLYEVIQQPIQNGALTPWLVINLLLHYRGKQTKDEPLSFGLNLIHGTLIKGMMECLDGHDFDRKVSDYCFPMTPVINLKSAYSRIEKFVENYTTTLDDSWIKDSLHQLEEEKSLLDSFYASEDIGLDQFTQEREQLDTRYRPRFSIEVINGGIFYMSQQTSQHLLMKKQP
ncbi:YqhG family protein [Halobacillus yeomjeoni]|uniref:YqhG n=1 Tax=Halobacillus yeomjeoni TaxID=311194 RepID=A0A931HUU5_9BACI|nr:YqhG family protein [Halobacillus yeomjeoni]MBH0229853.1 hypothetical protein [Halobacillus yeomjeoni]MCA0982769.1 YqhG family protein [Halobacillus yeomjeoni]